MLKFHEKNTENIVYRDIILLIVLVFVGAIIFFVSTRSYQSSSSTYCKASGPTSGAFTTKINVAKSSSYVIWARVESPVPINFNYSPGEFNPLYLSIDNSACFNLGQDQTISLNSWSWVNASLGSTTATSRFTLSKGVHVFSVSGLYSSVSELELLSNNCLPSNNGSNCLPQKNNLVYLPN